MKPTLNPTVLTALGLTSSDELRLVETFESPRAQTVQGFSARDLLLAMMGTWIPVGQGAQDIALRYEKEPSFVAFYKESVVEVLEGVSTEKNGMIAFDTRGAQACVRLDDGSILLTQDGNVCRYEAAPVDPFSDIDVPELPAMIASFDSVRWAQETQAEGWLVDAVRKLADQQASFPSVASAGLLARLWTRPEGVEFKPADLPRERVRAHILAATPAQRDMLEQHAVYRTGALADSIRGLDEVAVAATGEAVRQVIEERDNLQSVLRVLRLGGDGEHLARALKGVDALAEEYAASFANVLPSLPDDPQQDRWIALAWQEPDAWWSGLS